MPPFNFAQEEMTRLFVKGNELLMTASNSMKKKSLERKNVLIVKNTNSIVRTHSPHRDGSNVVEVDANRTLGRRAGR